MKKIFLFYVFLLFTQMTHGFSAGPVTHMYLAELWREQSNTHVDEKDHSEFLIGTLFPDIRYLGTIKREQTHKNGILLQEIYTPSSPFEAGSLLHSFVDEHRENSVVEWGIYDHLQPVAQGGHLASLLKYIEDDILYDKIDVLFAIGCLNSIPEDELKKGVSLKDLQKWHLFLTLYFCMRPSDIIEYTAGSNNPLLKVPAETVQLWNTHFAELRNKPEIQAYVDNLVTRFLFIYQTFLECQNERIEK